MSETPQQDVVPGGGPAEGEDASQASPNPNPDAVNPSYTQTQPGQPAPASTVEEHTGSDEGPADSGDEPVDTESE